MVDRLAEIFVDFEDLKEQEGSHLEKIKKLEEKERKHIEHINKLRAKVENQRYQINRLLGPDGGRRAKAKENKASVDLTLEILGLRMLLLEAKEDLAYTSLCPAASKLHGEWFIKAGRRWAMEGYEAFKKEIAESKEPRSCFVGVTQCGKCRENQELLRAIRARDRAEAERKEKTTVSYSGRTTYPTEVEPDKKEAEKNSNSDSPNMGDGIHIEAGEAFWPSEWIRSTLYGHLQDCEAKE
jgi:hypothetical protein